MKPELTFEQRETALQACLDTDAPFVCSYPDYGLLDACTLTRARGQYPDHYLVCTDAEADRLAYDEVLATAWTAGPIAIIDNMPEHVRQHDSYDFDQTKEVLEKIAATHCENANAVFLSMIADLDTFVKWSIGYNGRGPYLAHYDGEERESTASGEWLKVDGVFVYVYRL